MPVSGLSTLIVSPPASLKSGFLQSLQLFLWQYFLIMQRSNSLCVFIRCSLCRNGVVSDTFEQKWWLTLSLCPFSHAGSDPEGPHMGGASFRPSCGHHGGTPVDCNGTQQRQRDPVWVCVYLCFYIITPYLLPKPHILSELGLKSGLLDCDLAFHSQVWINYAQNQWRLVIQCVVQELGPFFQFHLRCTLCVLLLLGSLGLDAFPKCLLKQWNLSHFVTFGLVFRSAFAAPGTEVPVSFTAARSFNRQFPELPETTCKCTHDCTIIDMILQYLFFRKLWILTLYPSSGQSWNQQWFDGQVTGCSHLWKALNSGTNAWKRYIMTRMLILISFCWDET